MMSITKPCRKALNFSGNFNIYCRLLQKADGYSYQNIKRKEEGQLLTA